MGGELQFLQKQMRLRMAGLGAGLLCWAGQPIIVQMNPTPWCILRSFEGATTITCTVQCTSMQCTLSVYTQLTSDQSSWPSVIIPRKKLETHPGYTWVSSFTAHCTALHCTAQVGHFSSMESEISNSLPCLKRIFGLKLLKLAISVKLLLQ